MQRISTLASLIIFMLILNWLTYTYEDESMPREINPGGNGGQQLPADPDYYKQQYIFPNRSGMESPPDITENNKNDCAANGCTENKQADGGENREEQKEMDKPAENILPDPDCASSYDPLNNCSNDHKNEFSHDGNDDGYHFLIVGRKSDCSKITLAMLVTLNPETDAHITALSPAVMVRINGHSRPLENALMQGTGFGELTRALEEKTGLQPRFYMDLNLDGFVEMIDMLGGVNYRASNRVSSQVSFLQAGLNQVNGQEALSFLQSEQIGTVSKEAFLINMLTAAGNVENTSLGLSLLWTGYHNIKTDLSIKDLLQLRKVTQGISPNRVSLKEVYPVD